MKTKEQVEKEFREELRLLLARYKAELQVDIDGDATGVIHVYVDGVYTKDDETSSEYADFDIGSYCNGEVV